jgi:hypothetical protein
VVLVAGLAGVLVTGGFSSPSKEDQASATRSTTLYIAPDGSDGATCTKSRPCASFERAYQVSALGGTVIVTCGGLQACKYPDQRIPYWFTKTRTGTCRWGETFGDGTATKQDLSGCITFRLAPGARPSIPSITIAAPYVMLDGIGVDVSDPASGSSIEVGWSSTLGGECSAYHVHDVIVRNAAAEGLFIHGVTYGYVIGGTFGRTQALSSVVAGCYPGSGAETHTDHLAIDGATWRDDIETGPGQHLECIHWFDGRNSVVRNSRFFNCAQFDIAFQPDGTTPNSDMSNFLLESNILDFPCSHQKLNTQGGLCGANHATTFGCTAGQPAPRGIVIRYNSYTLDDNPQFIDDPNFPSCFKPAMVYGNIAGGPNSYNCSVDAEKGVVYTANVWTVPNTCGKGNSSGNDPSSIYVDPSSYDFSLRRGARAIDFVKVGQPRPPSDIDGDRRPALARTDAGADQWEAPVIVLGRSIGSLRIGESLNDAVEFYGRPRSQSTVAVGKTRLQRVVFPAHGGQIWALVDRGTVVGVGTTAGYYTTRDALGVTTSISPVRAWTGVSWVACRSALHRPFGPVGVFVKPAGGRNGARVSAVWMVRSSYGFARCSA